MTTLNAARDLGTTKKRAANEAPKHHAKKAKTSISVAGLFAKKPRTVREGLQPTDGTSRKHRSVEDELRWVVTKEALAHVHDGLNGRSLRGFVHDRPDDG